MFKDGEVFELRGFSTDKTKGKIEYRQWFTLADMPSLNSELTRPLFVGINPRTGKGKAGDDNVLHCRFLFADFDAPKGETVTVEQAEKRIADAGLPTPDPIVSSGRGVHAYWELTEPIDRDSFKALQKQLAELLGSDTSVCNAERIMRVPGSIHDKGEPVRVEMVSCINELRDLEDIVRCLPEPAEPAPPAAPLAEAEVRPLPGWIAGRIVNGEDDGNRNAMAFEIAAHLAGNGWAMEDATRHLKMFAENCRPPLPMDEAISTVSSAYSAPREPVKNTDTPPPPKREKISPVSLGKLIERNPVLSTPVIDGLLRVAETMNIIAASKVGKSWLMYALLISLATGRRWLDTYQCNAGRVLLIDNELHPQTIANRMPKVAAAMRVPMADIESSIDVISLRGKGITLDRLASTIERIEAGYYSVIVLDAWYRFIPKGSSENDNADVMALYNLLDQYAEQTGAAIVAVHHASKGKQGDKAVTDVGAGAGAQSRAADAHVVLRPHEDDGCVVLEAAVRSFAPVDPVGLRWEFPLWSRAEGLNTAALLDRKTKQEQKTAKNDAEGIQKIVEALRKRPLTTSKVRLHAGGMGRDRAARLLGQMLDDGIVTCRDVVVRGKDGTEWTLAK